MSKGTKLLLRLEDILKEIQLYEIETETPVSDFTSPIETLSKSLSTCDSKAEQIALEKAEADKAAREAVEAAEAEAEVNFVQYLNDNGFVGFAQKGGKVACLLEATLKKAAVQEAYEKFGILQCQAIDTAFDETAFNDQLLNFETCGDNRYCLVVYLNLKGETLRLEKFGGREVGTHFSK